MGCVSYYSTTSHEYMYHGTDFHGNGDFFYVAYGVFGSSTAIYDYQQRGDIERGRVESGLIADAKANLRFGNALEPNQAYANLSVDVMRTKSGVRGDGYVKKIVVEAVITADIIEYGQPPAGYGLSPSGHIVSDKSKPNYQSLRSNKVEDAPEAKNRFSEGQTVVIEFGGNPRGATVLEYSWDGTNNQYNYKCEYKTNSDNIRTTWRPEEDIKPAD